MTKDANKRFTFRLPKDLFEKIKKEAQLKGLSVNSFILKILWEWEEEQNKKKEQTREQVTIRLPKELKEEVQRQADRKGINSNNLIMLNIND